MRILFAIVLCLFSFSAMASAYRISPLKLEFDPARNNIRTKKLSLTNVANYPIVVQVTAVKWTQVDGRDIYEPTKDLFFAPPVVRIQPRSKKIIPVRFKGKQDGAQEFAYRIYLEEQPQELAEGVSGTSFRTRIGIPVFITPRSKPNTEPQFLVTRPTSEVMDVTINNTAPTRMNVTGVYLFPKIMSSDDARKNAIAQTDVTTNGAGYVLAGASGTFRLTIPSGADIANTRVWVYSDFERRNRPEHYPEGAFALDFAQDGKTIPADIPPVVPGIVPIESKEPTGSAELPAADAR